MPAALETRAFKTPAALRTWLARHHEDTPGLWIRFYKKGSGIPSVTYAEAVDEALCHGWIDGQANKGDDTSWVQRFTPRRPNSKWSLRNTELATRLIDAGRMKAAGQRAIDEAKKDGRWQAAYSPPSRAEVPADFVAALARDQKALAFFRTLNRANLFAIAYRLETAKKPETRQRRFDAILAMLARGEAFH